MIAAFDRLIHNNFLLVDTAPRHALLVDADGQPVWPLFTAGDRAAMETFAAKFGIEVRAVQGHAGATRPSADIVVAWGAHVEEEAQLYAHLTRRRFRRVKTLAELGSSHRPAVVVTTLDRVRHDLLSVLYTADIDGAAPGLICAVNVRDLRSVVLLRAAAANLQGPDGPRLLLSQMRSMDSRRDPDVVDLGTLPPRQLLERLREGAGVVSVIGHSDGVDGALGPDLVLCPMDRPERLLDPMRPSRCGETGICHRLHMPLSEALRTSTLVPPEAVSAWCLVWGACWGVMPPDGVVDPAAGLAPRFLGSPTLAVMLTTWNIAPISQGAVEELAELLHAGISVGEALSRFLKSHWAVRSGLRFCLFGDPAASVPARRGIQLYEPIALPPSTVRSDRASRVIDGSLADTAFLRALLQEDARYLPSELAPLSAEMFAILDGYGKTLASGRGDEDGSGPPMRRAVVKYLARRGPLLFGAWLPLASLDTPPPERTQCCPACRRAHNTTTSLIATIDVGETVRRRVRFCPKCGVVEDAPVESDASLSLRPPQSVRLRYRTAFRRPWAGVLVVQSLIRSERLFWKWPPGADGRPARNLTPEETWPVGPLKVGVIIVSGSQLTIVSQRWRGGAGPVANAWDGHPRRVTKNR
jgi:hypothetical protein